MRAGDDAYVAVTYQLPYELEPVPIDAQEAREFLTEIVDVVETRWAGPDEGIWEVRDQRRQFVTSVIAWVAVDRAIRLAQARVLPAALDRWRQLPRAIRG